VKKSAAALARSTVIVDAGPLKAAIDRGDVDHAAGDGALLLETAQAERRVRVVDVSPRTVIRRSRPEAAQLVELLVGDAARQIFVRYGFSLPAAREEGR